MKWEDALGLVEQSRKDKAAGKRCKRLCEWRVLSGNVNIFIY